jgi:GTP-binding protein
MLAITKSDLLDDELIKMIKKELPRIPSVFISSHSRLGLSALKDMLWQQLNS